MKNIFTSLYKKRFANLAIAFCLCLLSLPASAAVLVTIPSVPGTDTTNLSPTNRRTTYSAARMLFTASEIGTTGTITHLAFQKASGATTTSVNYISIYMKETTATTVSTTVPSGFPTGYTRVYNSSYIDNSMTSGWTTITLSTAVGDIMTFSGGSNNLDIVVVKTNSETATSSYPIYNCHTSLGPVSAYYFGSSALGSSFTSTTTKRPNIQLTIENTCAGKPAAGTVSGPSSAVCSGASFTLTGSGITLATGMKYQWQSRSAGFGPYLNTSTADTFASYTTSIVNNKDFRVYSTCLLSGQSDTSFATTVNVVNASVVTALSDTTFCTGGSVTLNTTTLTGVTYTWYKDGISTGATGASYVATTSGVYAVRASTGTCSGIFSNTKTVTVNPLPTATITAGGPTTFCDGLSVDLQANTGTGLSYQWQKGGTDISGATSSLYNATTSGNYRVKVTNSSTSCFNYSAVTAITVNPMPMTPTIVGAGGKTEYCAGSNLSMSTIPTSGVSYQWENLSGTISGATSSSYTATAPNTFRLNAILGACIAKSNALVITENPLPTAVISTTGSVSFCNGDSLLVNATTSTGVSYQWQESGTAIAGATTASIYLKAAGVYTVKVTNTTTGCSDQSISLTVNIISTTTPTIAAASATEFCTGGSVTLNATVGTGLTTQWQEAGTDIAGATAISYSTAVSGSYRMKVTSGVGCAAYSAPITVVVNPLPINTLSITGGTDICNGDATVLQAAIKPGYSYQWRNAGTAIVGATLNPYYAKTAGTYSVMITDSNGCQDVSADVPVTVKFVKAFYISPDGNTFFCDGERTLLVTQGGFTTYQWYYNGTFIPGATDTFTYASKNGKYAVEVQDPINGCRAISNAFNIVVIPAPDTPFITQVGTKLSTASQDVFYQWYKNGVAIPGATDSFTYTTGIGGVYAVTVTNFRDCSKTDTLDLNTSSIAATASSLSSIRIYPNPTSGLIYISAPQGISTQVLDMQGRLLQQLPNAQQIDISSYAAGIYILQFRDAQQQLIATQKVAKTSN